MELLTTEKDVVRLKCEHCGAHRVLSGSVYRRVMRRDVGVRCDTCTLVTSPAADGLAFHPRPAIPPQGGSPRPAIAAQDGDLAIAG